MLCACVPCMAQIDTIKIARQTLPSYDSSKQRSYFPYNAIRLTMLTPQTIKAFNGCGKAFPEIIIAPYKNKSMYGEGFLYNGRIFFVSKKEYDTLFALIRLVNGHFIMVNQTESTPYTKEYLKKGAYYILTTANGTNYFYVLSSKNSAFLYINTFIAAIKAAKLSSTTKIGVVEMCKTSLAIMRIRD